MASPFVVHDPEFLRALGGAPRLDRVADIDAHEGPVYVVDADALYFTSLPTPDWQVAIRRIVLDGERFPLTVDRIETVLKHTRVANCWCVSRAAWPRRRRSREWTRGPGPGGWSSTIGVGCR